LRCTGSAQVNHIMKSITRIKEMINQVLLHPNDYKKLKEQHQFEYNQYIDYIMSDNSAKHTYSCTLLGIHQNTMRSFVMHGITYVECRIQINGQYLIGEQ